MATQSIDLSENELKRTASAAKALGHPVRIAILKILAERETCFCGDLTEVIPLAQSTVSQHLKALKSAGLITGEVEGVKTCYCLNQDGVRDLKKLLNTLSADLSGSILKNCC